MVLVRCTGKALVALGCITAGVEIGCGSVTGSATGGWVCCCCGGGNWVLVMVGVEMGGGVGIPILG